MLDEALSPQGGPLSHGFLDLRRMVRGEVRFAEPLAGYTTLKVGGAADALVFPADNGDLRVLLQVASGHGWPVWILGHGSNVLVPDDGVRGIVVSLARCGNWLSIEGLEVLAGAGLPLPRLVSETVRQGLAGLECLAGIPGTVGGATFMNAGAGAAAIGDTVLAVEGLDYSGNPLVLSREEMRFAYRSSRAQAGGLVITAVRLRLLPGDKAALAEAVRLAISGRLRKQPLERPNAGSIFKNPPGDYAGRLIEAAGCKGWSVGGAQVSEKHANFIINTGGATAKDVLELMKRVYRAVWEGFGIALEPEIRLFGFPQHILMNYLKGAGGP